MLAWALWLWRLDASDLTFDETATYFVAHRPLPDILNYLRGAVREHPPVYYLLIRGWMTLAGTSEFSLRLFSVGAGLVALALMGWLARLSLGHSATAAGLVPAALLAVVPGMAYCVRDARMYSLGLVWTTLSAGLFIRDWLSTRRWPQPSAVAGLAAVHLLALFTHYYLLLPLLAQPLVLLITRRWRPFLAWCAVHILPAMAGLAWLWLAPGLQMTSSGFWRNLALPTPTSFQVFRLVGKVLFSPVLQVHFRLLYFLLALAGGGVLLALWRRRAVGVWLALAATVPLALAYVLPHPPAPRYLMILIPPVALALGHLCAVPLYLVKQRPLAGGATLGLVALVGTRLLIPGGLYETITFDRSHYGRTLELVKAYARPGDGVLFYGPWQWIQFHYYDPGGLPPITTLPPYAPPRLKPAEAEPVLEELLAQYDRLWVLPAAVDDVDPSHFVDDWLDTHAHAVWRTEEFKLYLPPLSADAPTQPIRVALGGTLRLESVTGEPEPVPAGEPLRLALRWRLLGQPEDDLWLTLQLNDGEGHVWDQVHHRLLDAQADSSPQLEPGQVITGYEGLLIPQGAPPGEYTVRLMVTEGVAGDPLQAEDDKWLRLLAVQVDEPTHAPVLHGLPNPQAATFCSPAGADCLTLAGYQPGGVRFQQGYSVRLTLHWLSPSRSLPELKLRLGVKRRAWLPLPVPEGRHVLTRTLPLILDYPAPLWGPDRLITLPTSLTLPPDAPTGPAQVTLEVLGPDGMVWPAVAGDLSFPLFDIVVESRPVSRRLPAGLTPIQADFGEEVGLRGYRVQGELHPGGQLYLTYAWYAKTRPTAIYAVFNHLMAADGTLVAQADGWPQEGRMLSIQWQAGEYVEDSYVLAIPPDAPPGPYTLYVGLYDAATDERQPATQNGQPLPEGRLLVPLPGEGVR